jgi:hypothetical protein
MEREPPSVALRSRRRAAANWAMRAGVELEAAARFRRIAQRLDATGAEPVVVSLAAQAARDEERHAARCVELVGRLDAPRLPGVARAPVTDLPEIGPRGLSAREQVLYEVVAMSCITESLSTALLGEMRDAAGDDRVREVLGEILRDEVQHARLGWAHLAAERRRGPCGFLADLLPAMLEGTTSDEVFQAGEPDPADVGAALRGLGALPRAERRDRLGETLTSVVFPGLESLGVDASRGRVWLERKLGASTEP